MLQIIKQNLFFGVSAILTAFSAISIMIFSNPENASYLTFFFLYLSIFLTLLSVLTLLGSFLRKRLFKNRLYIVNLNDSLRQGLLISILITVSLMLSSQGLLFWWLEASLILFLLSLEVFFNLKV